jgi:GTP-binding protein EngB required for normal cell division
MNQQGDNAIEMVSEIAVRYQLSSIEPLLTSCRTIAEQDEISIAVIGRFKAGKSSFLNHFLDWSLLPVGVIPVTAVVTEIEYGSRARAVTYFLDGRTEEVPVDAIRSFVAESENPENVKQVSRLVVELPTLERFKGLRFIDTPGLESALKHNTEASLNWLPNVGLALVAVSADNPLSQHDLSLLKSLAQYTPKISLLLTKADLLNDPERAEVISFIHRQLTHAFGSAPRIFPYSVRPGYEQFKTQIAESLIAETLAGFQEQRSDILNRKLKTLLQECKDYLLLALSSAEILEAERDALREQIIGEKEALDEVKSELRLIVRHATGRTRTEIFKHLAEHQAELETRLLEKLKAEFPKWTKSLNHALEMFEAWLRDSLAEEMTIVSNDERVQMLAPLEKVKKQMLRALQSFRDRLSERTLRVYGVALRTTEMEIDVEEPRRPDIYIGRVFDRNWELLSPITPKWIVKLFVQRHFVRKMPYMIEKNLSRLASQWADHINAAMTQVGKVAEQRLEELVVTVERLILSSSDDAPKMRADLEQVTSALAGIGHAVARDA